MKVMLTWIFFFLLLFALLSLYCQARPRPHKAKKKKASLLFFCLVGESYDFYFYHSQLFSWTASWSTTPTDPCIVSFEQKQKEKVIADRRGRLKRQLTGIIIQFVAGRAGPENMVQYGTRN